MMDSSRVDINVIARALGVGRRAVEGRANRGGWIFKRELVGGRTVRTFRLSDLPSEVQAAVLLKNAAAAEAQPQEPKQPRPQKLPIDRSEAHLASAWQRYEQVSDSLKEQAQDRLTAVLAVARLVDEGTPVTQARTLVAQRLKQAGKPGSPVQIWRWQRAVEGAPRDSWLPLLVPEYRGRPPQAEIPAEAWDLFKADYLRLEAPAAAACYDRLLRIAAGKGWQLPSLKTFLRRLKAQIPRPVQILARQGEEALMRTFPAQERRKDVFHALEAVNADGHTFDVFVRWPDGSIARPVMVAWQDLYSGKPLAWRVGQTENADLVRLSFGDLVQKYGIPKHAWLDNGRSFAAKMLTGGARTRYRFKIKDEDPAGLFTAIGMEVHWATPYHGQAKPIERMFKDLCETVAKHPAHAGAYTGNNPTAKPENYGSRAVPLADFMAVLDSEMAAHSARPGRRSKVAAGRSLNQVFNESYATATIRKATAEQRRLWMLAAEGVTAARQDGSVALLGNRYWSEALAPHAGQKLLVRFDPDHLHGSVHAYTLAGVYVGAAECVMSVGFADTQAGREHARAKTQYRRAAKAVLEAERRMDAAAVADQLPGGVPPELPAAGVLQPVFGKGKGKAAPAGDDALAATGTDDGGRTELLNSFLERRAAELADRIL